MYHTIPPQPDCASAWREAVRVVDAEPKHTAYDVIMAIEDPIAGTTLNNPRLALVNDFLTEHAKPINTVANTLFPQSLYRQHGAPQFFDAFNDKVLSKVRRSERWSGYYFERMMCYPIVKGDALNPLWDIVTRIRDPGVKALNRFELSLFDSARDVDRGPYGGQCLSHLSFKVTPGEQKQLRLTALYRNHYYIEKLLGNLVGLGRLMAFVAKEADLNVGPLIIHSTHAEIDQPKVNREGVKALLARFDELEEPSTLAQTPSKGSVA